MLKKCVSILLALLLVTATACSRQVPESADQRLQIVTSFYVLYDFTSKIGGDHVTVTNLVPPGADPHHWEPEAADLVRLEKADMLIFNGAGMEHWLDKVTAALSNKDLIMVETTRGMNLLAASHSHGSDTHHEDADHDQDHEDADHDQDDSDLAGRYDPHVWLDPLKALQQMQVIRDALVAALPQHADEITAAAAKYESELIALDEAFRDALADLTRREIVVAHEAFAYLTEAYGLKQIGIEGLASESEPDPARMAEIIAFARQHDIQVIFFEELASPKVAETIAREIGARTAVLNPLEGLTQSQQDAGEDYFTIMRQNLAALVDALS